MSWAWAVASPGSAGNRLICDGGRWRVEEGMTVLLRVSGRPPALPPPPLARAAPTRAAINRGPPAGGAAAGSLLMSRLAESCLGAEKERLSWMVIMPPMLGCWRWKRWGEKTELCCMVLGSRGCSCCELVGDACPLPTPPPPPLLL